MKNLPSEVALILRENGHDVVFVPEGSLRGSADEALTAVAIADGRVIVTRDVRWARQADASWPGVVLVRVPRWFRSHDMRAMIEPFARQARLTDVGGRFTIVQPNRITAGRIRGA